MKYVNCVRLIGGRSDDKNQFLKGISAEGKVVADFTDLLTILRGIIEAGFTPNVVLDNVPTLMSNPEKLHHYGNTYPPANFDHWKQYLQQMLNALIQEFGYDTVAGWRFRVGTEPDLYPGHWAGTKEQYLKHYDHTVAAITEIIPQADIGPGNILNPATGALWKPKTPRWGLDIIDHAGGGRNYVTGEIGTRMQHFSCSWYGRVGKDIDTFESAITTMRSRLNKYPQFADISIEVAEFMVLHDENNRRLWGGDTTEWGASFNAAITERAYDLNVKQINQWGSTTSGVLNPYAHVFAMLENMHPGQRLDIDTAMLKQDFSGAIAVRKDDDIYILLYHHRPERGNNINVEIELAITDSRMQSGQKWKVNQWAVDHNHSVFAYEFENDAIAAGIEPLPKAGRYESVIARLYGDPGHKLFQKHRAKYKKLAELKQTKTDQSITVKNNQIKLTISLPGHSVKLIKLSTLN